MCRRVPVLAVLGGLALLASVPVSCSRTPAREEPAHGESILDRVVHIEPALVTEIPATFRWCDRLPGLDRRRIDVGGAELYVELEGRGVPLVLINGGPGGTHHYFHPWFSRLKNRARVIYYDQRGCGLSDFKPGDKGYSVDQAVEDLDRLREALGFDTWVVLGYSYGGFLAQLYTVLHPERVAGLVLLGASTGMRADDGPTRQRDYLSEAERARMDELRKELNHYAQANGLPRQKFVELSIYNAFLNGDWKRQHFYRPSPDRLAQAALCEWVSDENFNGIVNQSQGRWDLTGAFEKSPIPTLILEGRYDLTWSEKKKDLLKRNHPHGRMVVFERAAHGIYDEDPDEFFRVLEEFVTDLPDVGGTALKAYQASLEGWVAAMKARPDIIIDSLSWGVASSRELASKFTVEWLETLASFRHCLRAGFALYDVERYRDALTVFERLEAKFGDRPQTRALGLLWQGQMLDLLGRRAEAVERYRKVADMNLTDSWSHDQYGLRYELSPYARERLKTPFTRLENRALE